jgi:hypothetical protein
MALFEYQDRDSLGRVSSVDSATVLIEVADTEQLKRLQVNRLAVLQSSKPGQHLIGSITQVTRKKVHLSGDIGNDDFQEHNLCKIYLIGTFLDRDGDKSDVFRRTLGSVPEIDANCFALEGEHLTQFMRILSNTTAEGTSLTLGRYSLDENAVAYLNGNKLFQRHAFIGGSTGSGKSWTTATIIEQIANLSHASSIVFDIHGEYAPLNGENISHLKIAGATDIEESRSIEDGIIHLPYWLLTYEALVSLFVDRSDQNAPNQSMIIAREINEEKRKYLSNGGHSDVMSSFTIDSPVPFEVQSLLDRLNQINSEMVEGANNRVIVASDGNFNVGISGQEALVELIEEKRESGIFLTILGVGSNVNEGTLEQIANNGNGNFEYLDNEDQLDKVFIDEFNKFYTVAKDVKVQVEFNSSVVEEYRLIGYENRLLSTEEFLDDTKDAGEIGAGQSITALYELKLVSNHDKSISAFKIDFRYKEPDSDVSQGLDLDIFNSGNSFDEASNDHRFAASVASFGLLLRDSEYKGDTDYSKIKNWATSSRNYDPFGYKSEFLQLIDRADDLD